MENVHFGLINKSSYDKKKFLGNKEARVFKI